ncbi:MAG TPA: error-prone DNA polymerase [Tepidisphaeraceae bacterium]|jgi:error-prone DNA polymerase|nr:error-prone DNA polymerase [Tepidisphaeraceae bacterium]
MIIDKSSRHDPELAELDVTSNFSFLRGGSHPQELVYRAAELGYAAVAITDLNSLAGVVRAHQAAKDAQIKLCVGARLRFTDAPDVLVWAQNRGGYANLCRLLTTGKRRAEKGSCTLRLEDLLNAPAGLLAAVALQRIDPQTDEEDGDGLEAAAAALKDVFGERLSLAVSRLYGPEDGKIFRRIESVGRARGVPLLATNQVHYHDERRRVLQDVLTCIRHGCTIQEAGFRLFPNGERFIKPPGEMQRLFSDFPEALKRTAGMAEQCAFSLDELRYEYPDEIVPAGKTPASYLAELTWEGAASRYPQGVPEKVRRQIGHELTLIEQLKIEPYFLTVYDLVCFARGRGILCQGRGSAANSAVCYCLGVTSVDPTQIDLLFERFVSAARNEPPDIDIDFEHERREEVIQYLYGKYGRERAGMTAEVISYRGRSAVRDIGKTLGLGLDAVDQIAKSLNWWHSGPLSPQQLAEAGLDPNDYTIRLLVGLTGELRGFPRHLSQHVGGMVMTRGPLCELVPIENGSMQDRTVIEWDKDDIDAVGILKVDVLGLGMLTALAKGMKLINGAYSAEQPIELHTISQNDSNVYDMIGDADTIGVFQIESRAQMSMLPRLKPKDFYDLVIEVAIVRPGPIQGDMVHPYLRRRNGEEIVDYPSDALRNVLKKTLGVPLFQEQAMKVVMVAAGFSAEEADQLRRAMAAWRYSGHIERFQEKIINGMLANGYTPEFAERCFNQIKGFGEYGFPESHAASFALLVYASAWIKRYHPAAFCCALINSQPMGFYAPAQIVRDAREHGVEVRPIDVNFSDWDCTLEDSQSSASGNRDKNTWGHGGPALRLGMRLIKGMRAIHAERIVESRRGGAFTSVEHFHQATKLPKSAIEQLAQADVFGSLPRSRRTALWQTMGLTNEHAPLFEDRRVADKPSPVVLAPMPLGQEVMIDYAVSGLSLKQHPVAFAREQLIQRKIITAAELKQRANGWARVAGIVLNRQRPGTANGIVFVTLEDETGVANLIIRPNIFNRYSRIACGAYLLQADGYVERQGQVIHVIVLQLEDLSHLLSGHEFRSRDFK